MYTTIIFKACVKPEYREALREMVEETGDWIESNIPLLKDFGSKYRSDFIFLFFCIPDDSTLSPRMLHETIDTNMGIWTTTVEFINRGQLEAFSRFLPQIVDSAEIEYLYEESNYSKRFELVTLDNSERKIVCTHEKYLLCGDLDMLSYDDDLEKW